MRFWARDTEHADWPEPRAEYLSSLADSVRQTRRDARRSRFTLGLAPAAVALVLAVAAFAGVSTATGAGSGVVKSFKSFVVNSKSDHPNGNGKDVKGKKGEDDNDQNGEDNENDDGQYDQYDNQCDNGDSERRSLQQQQSSERRQLLQALTAPHPGQTSNQLRRAFAQHQQAAVRVLNAKHDRCNGDHGNGDHGNGDHGNGGHGGHGGGGD